MRDKISIKWLQAIQLVLAYEWLSSGLDKFLEDGFMAGIAKTLALFASKTSFGFYGTFLKNYAIPNAELFGNVVRYSEVLIGLGLSISVIAYYGLPSLRRITSLFAAVAGIGGALLNLNLFWAASFSSPSTAGINVVMGWTALIIGIYYLKQLLRPAAPAKDKKK